MKHQISFFFFLLFISTKICAQCVECHSFTEALQNPEKVKKLSINGNVHGIQIDTIPSGIGDMKNLEILWLSAQEHLKELAEEIKKLTKLRELSFASDALTDLPDFIYEMTQLKEVILLNNPMSEATIKKIKKSFKEKLPGTRLLIWETFCYRTDCM